MIIVTSVFFTDISLAYLIKDIAFVKEICNSDPHFINYYSYFIQGAQGDCFVLLLASPC